MAESRAAYEPTGRISKKQVAVLIKELESQMKNAARNLEFEKAALIRDRIIELRRETVGPQIEETAGDSGKKVPKGRRARPSVKSGHKVVK